MATKLDSGRGRSPTGYFLSFCDDLDAESFEAVVELTTPQLRRAACTWLADSSTIDEAIQSTWVTAYLKRNEFDTGRRFTPWLIGIFRRCLLRLRRRHHRSSPAVEAFDELATETPPDRELLAQETRIRILWAVDTQTPTYREILKLHLLDELGPAAIAHRLSRNPSTVRNQLSRGLTQLRKSLGAG